MPSPGLEAFAGGRLAEEVAGKAGELAETEKPAAALKDWLRHVATHISESRVLADAFMATHDGPPGAEPPQITAWHGELHAAPARS